MKKYCKLNIIIAILICLTVYTVSAAYEWETYDYSRFNNYTYVYDIGGNFKNIDLDYYNGVLKDMKSKYGITYTFIIVDDYNIVYDYDTAWDLAALIREKAGFSEDYISVAVTVGPGERDYAVYTLGQGQMVMNDSYVEGMLDALLVNLRNNNWDGALDTFIDLAVKMTDSYINDTDSVKDNFGNTIYIPEGDAKKNIPVANIAIISAIVGLVISLAAVFIELGRHKPVKSATNADFYVKDENVRMNVSQDNFLRSHETRVRVNNSSGSGGGGGRSGGSSFGGGSSGRSGGGGSRRF